MQALEGDHRGTVRDMDVEPSVNREIRTRVDKPVFFVSLGVLVLVTAVLLLNPDSPDRLRQVHRFMTHELGFVFLGFVFLGLIWLALIASVLADPSRSAHLEAVVVVPEAQARAADSINAPLRFGQSLPEGAEVRVLEDRGGWLHIELQNGRDGWIIQNQVKRVVEEEP